MTVYCMPRPNVTKALGTLSDKMSKLFEKYFLYRFSMKQFSKFPDKS